MARLRYLTEQARAAFWLLPLLAVLAGIVAGVGLPLLDRVIDPDSTVIVGSSDGARALTQAIATVTFSAAGIVFSVTVVALQLASSQLSPRVLRTFQANRVAQGTLATLLGTFVYALLVLRAIRGGEEAFLPNIALSVALLAGVGSVLVLVAFIHEIVTSLQASTIIRRIAAHGHLTLQPVYPGDVGRDPEDLEAAQGLVRERTADDVPSAPLIAPRAGYLYLIDGGPLLRAAREQHALVVQHRRIGEFVVTGDVMASVYTRHQDGIDNACSAISGTFKLGGERTGLQDSLFPVRQLADVALRALSPSVNDPTTAQNAMNSIADMVVRFIRSDHPSPIRVDMDGEPRLVASHESAGDLVREGFDQIRQQLDSQPRIAVNLLGLLASVRREARDADLATEELDRQMHLVPVVVRGGGWNEEDLRPVLEAHDRHCCCGQRLAATPSEPVAG